MLVSVALNNVKEAMAVLRPAYGLDYSSNPVDNKCFLVWLGTETSLQYGVSDYTVWINVTEDAIEPWGVRSPLGQPIFLDQSPEEIAREIIARIERDQAR